MKEFKEFAEDRNGQRYRLTAERRYPKLGEFYGWWRETTDQQDPFIHECLVEDVDNPGTPGSACEWAHGPENYAIYEPLSLDKLKEMLKDLLDWTSPDSLFDVRTSREEYNRLQQKRAEIAKALEE